MFLGVSGTVAAMTSSASEERAVLGELIRQRRESVFGTKRAAYSKAEVNAATWDKAEAGESVRGDLLRKIVRALWPDTDGDWTRLVATDPSRSAGVPAEPDRDGLGAYSDQTLLAEIADRLARRREPEVRAVRATRISTPTPSERGGAQAPAE
jgi:hypothetical protein